jgi:predicted  nucleic acid-binding Zn-ribbon protein
MTTQDQKDKKIATAEKALGDVQGKLTKKREALAKLEADYLAAKEKLATEIRAIEPEVRTQEEYVTWVKGMPVSGSGSGELGAPAPADSTEE